MIMEIFAVLRNALLSHLAVHEEFGIEGLNTYNVSRRLM